MPRPLSAPRPVLLARLGLACLCLACLLLSGCMQADISLFGDPQRPYREQVLSGTGPDKILLLGIDGLISEHTREGVLRTRPGTVQELAAQLKLARRDKGVKAVVLRIDSPGGTTTASDILYHELMAYKAETKVPVVAAMMGLAASGGYYVALPADHILAHPTTITGSVGVIFVMPRLAGLMDKLGVGVDVSKSGALKDMGSPFRPATEEERALTQGMTQALARRFQDLVQKHRALTPEAQATVFSARVFTAEEARGLGLVDSVGYLDDALQKARGLASLAKDARVVAYRRRPAADTTYYQPGVEAEGGRPALVHLDVDGLLPPRAGMYYLWSPAYTQD